MSAFLLLPKYEKAMDRIAALEAENAALRLERDRFEQDHETLKKTVSRQAAATEDRNAFDALRAKVHEEDIAALTERLHILANQLTDANRERVELKADAERYRWLRETDEILFNLMGLDMLREKLDAAIDAARRAEE